MDWPTKEKSASEVTEAPSEKSNHKGEEGESTQVQFKTMSHIWLQE